MHLIEPICPRNYKPQTNTILRKKYIAVIPALITFQKNSLLIGVYSAWTFIAPDPVVYHEASLCARLLVWLIDQSSTVFLICNKNHTFYREKKHTHTGKKKIKKKILSLCWRCTMSSFEEKERIYPHWIWGQFDAVVRKLNNENYGYCCQK